MACFKPLNAWQANNPRQDGKKGIYFSAPTNFLAYTFLKLPCGQCVGCKMERSRQWAIRCLNEASLYSENSFITLTYSPEFLPSPPSINIHHFQKFLKRLRISNSNKTIRFYHAAEYGTLSKRPHYHAIIFNHDFEDKILFSNKRGTKLYTSETLKKLWPYGYSSVGSVTFQSAAYVARYLMKKITGDAALDHYQYIDDITGEIHQLTPEKTTMSLKPGIGADWFKKYKDDVYPHDYIIINNQKMRPPKYYDGLYEILEPEELLSIKEKRLEKSLEQAQDSTPARLAVREKIQNIRLKKLPRNLNELELEQ